MRPKAGNSRATELTGSVDVEVAVDEGGEEGEGEESEGDEGDEFGV